MKRHNALAFAVVAVGALVTLAELANHYARSVPVAWPLLTLGVAIIAFGLAFADPIRTKAAADATAAAGGAAGSIVGAFRLGRRDADPVRVPTGDPAHPTAVLLPGTVPVAGAPFDFRDAEARAAAPRPPSPPHMAHRPPSQVTDAEVEAAVARLQQGRAVSQSDTPSAPTEHVQEPDDASD